MSKQRKRDAKRDQKQSQALNSGELLAGKSVKQQSEEPFEQFDDWTESMHANYIKAIEICG